MNQKLATQRTEFFEGLESWKPSNSARVIRYFSAVDLRNGHDGLYKIAKKHGIDLSGLKAGEFILFVNNPRTAVKMFAPNNVVAHFKVPGNGHLNMKCLALLPSFFNGSTINYSGALKETIEKDFLRKYK